MQDGSERPEPTGWRFGLDFEESIAALEYPPGLDDAAKALEWYFEGLPHEDGDVARSVLPTWRRFLDERGPHYSLSTNSADATRLDLERVELSSFFGHFEPVVISNALFEEAVSAFQDFAEHEERYR